jgi:putative nucleotidyltransferase with HDIG domain
VTRKADRPAGATPAELRRQAEETLREKTAQTPENLDTLSPVETLAMLHELRVHQIELEMQNEELRRAQLQLDTERARYFDLWDLAPVGYLTISETGLILKANLTAVSQLEVPRTLLVRRPFSQFLLKEDQDVYYLHLRQILQSGEPQSCELRMANDDNTARVGWIQLEAILAQDEAGASAEYRGPDERRKSPRRVIRIVLSDISERKQAEEVLRESYDTTLEGWAHALELRDHGTVEHSRNVVQLTVDLARAMGFAEDGLTHIRRGALLHDIGKMGVPDSILLKPGTLDECEWEIMRRHPQYAYELLEPIEYLRPVLDIPYCHHEKWDGSGYPRGLKGEEIPLPARLFAIVDVWDALRTDRPYRKAWPIENARTVILEQSGYHFDPMVVHSFLEIIEQ